MVRAIASERCEPSALRIGNLRLSLGARLERMLSLTNVTTPELWREYREQ